MSKVTLLINIEFTSPGQEREQLCVNLTPHQDNPSDEHVADMIREEVLEHLMGCPRSGQDFSNERV
ncbi:hypothetical protein AO073_27150 [Pseudomonas syringae ICMP 11293]|uniref:hypothetical protein n=1 Tax=Pseudomonas syringae TaxID=317 RepID=UPI000730F8D8|nr:hypothetical protein [Pseudomonas syringae]KTB90226.1 hypothetical protein AO073_27150 [Pseudomonas syringae ICMP 11293]